MVVCHQALADDGLIKPTNTIGEKAYRHDRQIVGLLPSKDGKALEVVLDNGVLVVWDVGIRKQVECIAPKGKWYIESAHHIAGSSAYLINGALYGDREILSRGLHLVDRETGKAHHLAGRIKGKLSVAAVGSKLVAYYTEKRRWEIRSLKDGKLVQAGPINKQAHYERSLVFSGNEDLLIESVHDGDYRRLRGWRIGHDEPIWSRERKGDSCPSPKSVFGRPGRNHVLTLTETDTIPAGQYAECFEMKTGKLLWKTETSYCPTGALWSTDGSHLLIQGHTESGATVLDGDSGKEIKRLKDCPDGKETVQIGEKLFSVCGYMVFEYGLDWRRLFPEEGSDPATFGAWDQNARTNAGSYFAWSSKLNLETGEYEVWEFPDIDGLRVFQVSPSGGLIAYLGSAPDKGGEDDSVSLQDESFLWVVDLKTKKIVRIIELEEDGASTPTIHFSQSEKFVFLLEDRRLHQFKVHDKTDEGRILSLPKLKMGSVGFHRRPFITTNSDFRLIVVSDYTVYLWELGETPRVRKLGEASSVGRTGANSDIYAFDSGSAIELWRIPSKCTPLTVKQRKACVNELRHTDFSRRKAATEHMIDAGYLLDLDALSKVSSDDPEVKERIREVRQTIESRFAATRIGKFEFDYNERPEGMLFDNDSCVQGFVLATNTPVQHSDLPSIVMFGRLDGGAVKSINRFSSGSSYSSLATDGKGLVVGHRLNGLFDIYDLKDKSKPTP